MQSIINTLSLIDTSEDKKPEAEAGDAGAVAAAKEGEYMADPDTRTLTEALWEWS